MPGMSRKQEEHLMFILNRAYNVISERYHTEQGQRDAAELIMSPEQSIGVFDIDNRALLDEAIGHAAQSLIRMITVRAKLARRTDGE